jgi:capsular exopolysaccharide synthesis family protein
MPQFSGTKDLRNYVRVLWRWKFLFLAFLIAAPVAAYLVERGKPTVYKSSALVGVNQETVNTSLLGSNGSFSTTNVTAVAQLVNTRPVAHTAATLMRPPANPNAIMHEVTASGNTVTNFITISATDPSPVRAAAIANAFAKAITQNRQAAAIAELNGAIAGVKAQLAKLGSAGTNPTSAQSGTRAQLDQQLNQLTAAKSTQRGDATILQSAAPSGTPAGPHTRRTVELGLVIGLLLGLAAVVLAENADRRLRNPEDLEGMADVPLLASIPPSAFSKKLDTGPADEESFQMLRTALLYFNVDRARQSVVVTSPGEKDGKTTVAVRLALSAARAGLRVILVDADLRRAQVGARLRIQAEEGLGMLLAGHCTVDEVLRHYDVDEPGAGSLTVLPAGRPAINPAALISSPEMIQVLRRLEADADLVIIDTPAALMVSDPLPLIELASGVLLVARMNKSTRDKVRRLRKIVASAHGNLLGVVATGVASGPGYGYYASKYYKEARNGQVAPRNGRASRDQASARRVRRVAREQAGEGESPEGQTGQAEPEAVTDEFE